MLSRIEAAIRRAEADEELSGSDIALIEAFLNMPGNRPTIMQLSGREEDPLAGLRLIVRAFRTEQKYLDRSPKEQRVVEPVKQPEPSRSDENAMLSPTSIADRYGLDAEQVRKRLDRWRDSNPAEVGTGFIENCDRKPREPRWLYRLGSVLRIVREIKPSGEASDERPAKK